MRAHRLELRAGRYPRGAMRLIEVDGNQTKLLYSCKEKYR